MMRVLFTFAIATATLVSAQAPRYRIDSISGTSSIGDGSAATSALLGFPNSVLADSKGGFYIGDDQNFRIRYVAANGTITTVVGNGSAGLTPNGVAGLENTVTSITAMAISANGDLHFVDPVSCIVSRLDSQGIVRRVAGVSRTCGFSGDRGPATSAQLNSPFGIAFDPQGRLLIADQYNHRIRRVNADNTIETIGGTGDSQIFAANGLVATQSTTSFPGSLAVAPDGTIYFAEVGYRRVRKIGTDGRITNVAGDGFSGNSGDDGPATSARFREIAGIAFDGPRNRLFISDAYWQRVRAVNLNAGTISHTAGILVPSLSATSALAGSFTGDGGQPKDAGLDRPYGISVDSNGSLLIADLNNNRIRRVDATIRTVAGRFRNTADGPANRAEHFPASLALNPAGELLIADYFNKIIRRVAGNGTTSTLAGTPPERYVFKTNGGDNGPATSANFANLIGLAVDATGRTYVNDDGRIRRIDGATISAFGANSGFVSSGAGAMAVDRTRNLLYLADSSTQKILVADLAQGATFRDFAGTGTAGFSGDGGQARLAQLNNPGDLDVDAAGNLYIADVGNNRVRRVDLSGVITTILGSGVRGTAETAVSDAPALEAAIFPTGMTVDSAGRITLGEGRIPMIRQYDPATKRIRRIVGGEPRAVAGTGSGTALVRADASGNIYFAGVDMVVRTLRPVQLSRFELVSGNSQSAGIGTKLAAPLVVRIAATDGPVSGIPVSFTSSGAAFNPATAFTDAEGLAKTEVTLGTTLGSVTINAALEGLPTISFQATATTGGGVVVNPNRPALRATGGAATASAFGGGSTISAGTWMEIYGTNLSTVTRSWGDADFRGSQAPVELDGVRVTVGGRNAFVAFVSPGQINVQVPDGIATGPVAVAVINANGTSDAINVTAAAASPALLAPPVFAVGGVQYVAALHQDGAFVGRVGLIAGANFRPAKAGDVITLYGIGFGATAPAIPAGQVVGGIANLADVKVRIGDREATVLYGGLAPSAIGLYQFNVVMPAGSGELPLVVTAGALSTQRLTITGE